MSKTNINIIDNGVVYGCGSNELLQLSINKDSIEVLIPQIIEDLNKYKIVSLSAGNTHSVFVDGLFNCLLFISVSHIIDKGVTYQCGSNEKIFSVKYLKSVNVKQVTCGETHNIALDSKSCSKNRSEFKDLCIDEGCVYTWGDSSFGKLGHDNSSIKINSLKGIIGIAGGSNHTMLLTNS